MAQMNISGPGPVHIIVWGRPRDGFALRVPAASEIELVTSAEGALARAARLPGREPRLGRARSPRRGGEPGSISEQLRARSPRRGGGLGSTSEQLRARERRFGPEALAMARHQMESDAVRLSRVNSDTETDSD